MAPGSWVVLLLALPRFLQQPTLRPVPQRVLALAAVRLLQAITLLLQEITAAEWSGRLRKEQQPAPLGGSPCAPYLTLPLLQRNMGLD